MSILIFAAIAVIAVIVIVMILSFVVIFAQDLRMVKLLRDNTPSRTRRDQVR